MIIIISSLRQYHTGGCGFKTWWNEQFCSVPYTTVRVCYFCFLFFKLNICQFPNRLFCHFKISQLSFYIHVYLRFFSMTTGSTWYAFSSFLATLFANFLKLFYKVFNTLSWDVAHIWFQKKKKNQPNYQQWHSAGLGLVISKHKLQPSLTSISHCNFIAWHFFCIFRISWPWCLTILTFETVKGWGKTWFW